MIIPAIMTALVLGTAFDEPSLTTKPYYIYDPDAINNSILTIHNPYTKSYYRLIESSSESNNFLSVDGELALKAKHGKVGGNLQGLGKYLTNPINRKKTIELLCTVYHETVTQTFPTYTPQKKEWKSKRPEQVGTHYIRSITYGGQLIISYKMIVKEEQDMEEIKAAVDGAIANEGSFDAHVAGNLDMLKHNFGSKFQVEISTYATTGVFSPPANLIDVLTLIQDYPRMVKKVNNGKGAAVRFDIQELSMLDAKFTAKRKFRGMNSVYNDAINKLDDLIVADKEFKDWEKKKLWDDEQQRQIDTYYARLRKSLTSMKHAISSMDTTDDLHQGHFDQAFQDYGAGKENIPNRYMRELANLTHHIENIPFYWFPYTTASTHYIHWGSINCSLPSTEPVYVGYAASSPKGFGNGGDILCLDMEPEFESSEKYKGSPVSRLSGITYLTPTESSGFAYCAFCRLENATSVETVAGRKTCPQDMKLEYTGFLATNLKANSRFICMAEQPDDKIIDLHAKQDSSAGKIVPLWMQCEECDGEEEEKARYIPCAVCSR